MPLKMRTGADYRNRATGSGLRPGTFAAQLLRRHANHEAGRRVVHRRGFRIRPHVGVREPLQQLRRATLLDPRGSAHDEVPRQPALAESLSLDGDRYTRILLDVLDLPVAAEVRADDLIVVQADPDAGHLRAAVGVERDHVAERVGL